MKKEISFEEITLILGAIAFSIMAVLLPLFGILFILYLVLGGWMK